MSCENIFRQKNEFNFLLIKGRDDQRQQIIMNTNTLPYLPSEMLEQIFLFLSETDAKTAANILRVSRRFGEIIKNNKEIKYNIIMGVNGQAEETPIKQFQWAREKGLTEIMEIIRNKFKITLEDIENNDCEAMVNACNNGDVETAKGLMNRYEIDFKGDATKIDTLRAALHNCNPELGKFFDEKYNLNKEARDHGNIRHDDHIYQYDGTIIYNDNCYIVTYHNRFGIRTVTTYRAPDGHVYKSEHTVQDDGSSVYRDL